MLRTASSSARSRRQWPALGRRFRERAKRDQQSFPNALAQTKVAQSHGLVNTLSRPEAGWQTTTAMQDTDTVRVRFRTMAMRRAWPTLKSDNPDKVMGNFLTERSCESNAGPPPVEAECAASAPHPPRSVVPGGSASGDPRAIGSSTSPSARSLWAHWASSLGRRWLGGA